MSERTTSALFDLGGRVAVVTGASGTLGGEMARGLAAAGATVAVLGRDERRIARAVDRVRAGGGRALGLAVDVLDGDALRAARETLLAEHGRVDVLVNAAGGNVADATLPPGGDVFDLPADAFRQVFDLNLLGTLLPIQAFGPALCAGDDTPGVVVNVSSMTAARAVTRVIGYSAAKAAVDNLTRWLAVELARRHGDRLRVNAIAPGFFVADQNRRLLLEEDGSLTERGRTIVEHTPAGRFGEADDLVGTLLWLCSDASRFVNGVIVPVDGGFSAFSGV